MPAIQDAIPHNHCWGCGTLNPHGLRIKSYPEGEETVCRFDPPREFMAGPTSVLYGGTIAS
ncbi:MAG TPA: PaaI family thioesterase, partial [Anaeromyxobacteraceae bacterium]|nr:PaaI family thioesterase [Anaeromyxobacteraceae bacterium]